MDTYADDLAALIETLDLHEVTLVGFSTGGGEVARYVGRHGTGRVARIALVSAVPPFMLPTPDNPAGVPIEVFDGLRTSSFADRSQLYRDLADGPFFGGNRPGANPSQGIRDSFWLQGARSNGVVRDAWAGGLELPREVVGLVALDELSRADSGASVQGEQAADAGGHEAVRAAGQGIR